MSLATTGECSNPSARDFRASGRGFGEAHQDNGLKDRADLLAGWLIWPISCVGPAGKQTSQTYGDLRDVVAEAGMARVEGKGIMVGASGLEPPASTSRTLRSAILSYAPNPGVIIRHSCPLLHSRHGSRGVFDAITMATRCRGSRRRPVAAP